MTEQMPLKFPKTVSRSQLATALGYAKPSGGVYWSKFNDYLLDVLGEDWETRYRIRKGQRLFNTVQTAKIIHQLELKPEMFL